MTLDVIFRVYLNQELSKCFGTCFYSPAPQRGELINSFIKNTQNTITYEIEKIVSKKITTDHGYRDYWLEYLSKNKGTNMPLLMLYYLHKKLDKSKTKGSFETYFSTILELREDPEIIHLRYDLKKLQDYFEKDINEYEKRMLSINEKIEWQTKDLGWNIMSLISEFGTSSLTQNPIPLIKSVISNYKDLSETKFFKYNYLSSIRQSFIYNDDFIIKFKKILGIEKIQP